MYLLSSEYNVLDILKPILTSSSRRFDITTHPFLNDHREDCNLIHHKGQVRANLQVGITDTICPEAADIHGAN